MQLSHIDSCLGCFGAGHFMWCRRIWTAQMLLPCCDSLRRVEYPLCGSATISYVSFAELAEVLLSRSVYFTHGFMYQQVLRPKSLIPDVHRATSMHHPQTAAHRHLRC